MFDVNNPKHRRHFFLERGLRKRPIGSGSNLAHLMSLPRTVLPIKPEEIFGDIPVLVAGGVATRAYAPERATKDIDFVVEHDRYADAIRSLRERNFTKQNDLFFPNTSLGLYGEAWLKDGQEIDLISSPQEWCKQAFRGRIADQTGLRVIPLAYLVLMKYDSARVIDQADLSRMLGQLNDENLEHVVKVVKRFSGDPSIADGIRQYAQLGRWELETNDQGVLDHGR